MRAFKNEPPTAADGAQCRRVGVAWRTDGGLIGALTISNRRQRFAVVENARKVLADDPDFLLVATAEVERLS